ncbi:uncharacterized protein A4U43_C10F14500 [Asparagus officinalis]|uniref:Uncharacterized protein n=1 Tax=Asparagus officinalis TaxID=4686 RepID=A0A5P1E7J0_ASPOF|nr:uncharacterized protein A4U43_C10F14490 [Asparagus officinalis]ONK56906.1 uncharacterized protein A4U43_C10F14500 [Asparagus officinalis]
MDSIISAISPPKFPMRSSYPSCSPRSHRSLPAIRRPQGVAVGNPNKPPKPRRSAVFAGGGEGEGEGEAKQRRAPSLNLRWRELLDPDPENIVAIALTGLLTWASVQVLGQLFFISIAILLAALKYSFIAALLLFILITLL